MVSLKTSRKTLKRPLHGIIEEHKEEGWGSWAVFFSGSFVDVQRTRGVKRVGREERKEWNAESTFQRALLLYSVEKRGDLYGKGRHWLAMYAIGDCFCWCWRYW
jgi:hypothetical protein